MKVDLEKRHELRQSINKVLEEMTIEELLGVTKHILKYEISNIGPDQDEYDKIPDEVIDTILAVKLWDITIQCIPLSSDIIRAFLRKGYSIESISKSTKIISVGDEMHEGKISSFVIDYFSIGGYCIYPIFNEEIPLINILPR